MRSTRRIAGIAAQVNFALVVLGTLVTTAAAPGDANALRDYARDGEMEAFLRDVQLTPLQALRSATLGPAQFLGATDSLGSH